MKWDRCLGEVAEYKQIYATLKLYCHALLCETTDVID